jgi:multimeric flavodoxin WrbA
MHMKETSEWQAVGIAGSPRKRGNSSALLRAYLKGVSSEGYKTEFIYLNGMLFRGCQACDRCVEGKSCSVKDDLNSIFPVLQKAQIWALASPIYYDGVSGQLKMFFDRLRFTTYDPNKLKGPRRGILIVTYEDDRKKEYFETASQLANYFDWNNRGNFGKVRIVTESNLGPKDAWKSRPDLLDKLKKLGKEQAKELKRLL